MKKRYISIILSLVLVVIMAAPAVAATTQTTSNERGVMYLSWEKNTITWTYNSTKITSSDAWQQSNGVFIATGGVTKLNQSSSVSHYYNFKSIIYLGAVIDGVVIGHHEDHIDQGIVAYTGFRYWNIDIG